MGMDVFGRQPTAKVGEYFRNNVWWWRPLADLCCAMAPEICAKCEHWQSNDGDGLYADDAAMLAATLDARIKNGDVAAYIKARDAAIDALPDEPCWLCDGTGIRSDALGVATGDLERVITGPPDHPRLGQQGWCNGCDGRGTKRPWEADYPCDAENVAAFAAFLKHCGGFEIW